MSKDRVAHVHARTTPYATPRRPLHVTENAAFNGRPVRQANPACSLPQFSSGTYAYTEFCNEYKGRVGDVETFRAFAVLRLELNQANNRNESITCAKLACDTGRPIQTDNYVTFYEEGIRRGETVNDTRCFVARLPHEFTIGTPTFPGNGPSYEGIEGTFAASIRPYHSTYGFVEGIVGDVDTFRCHEGETNSSIARQIQREFGLRNDSVTTEQPSITPTKVAITATATGGVLSTLAAFVTPTPTAVIAASVPNVAITGLAVGLGVLGSGVAIGAASYAGYKLVQHCRTSEKVIPAAVENIYDSAEPIYEEIKLGKLEAWMY